MEGLEMCSKCGLEIKINQLHLCPLDSRLFTPLNVNSKYTMDSTIIGSDPATTLLTFDTKTEQINKLNEELKIAENDSSSKDDYIIKLKRRNKKLLENIQELYLKYLEMAVNLPEPRGSEFSEIIDNLLNEIVQDINHLMKPDE